ncbi:YidB family protein [Streptomyces virginiae]|uniref:YidB family protein n=1 Tax=Streptomyces virginiae TaxID=1961 RepID=UPI0036CC5AE8
MADEPTLPQFASWLGAGPNEPVTADQLTASLGEERLSTLAANVGRDPGELAQQLATELPDFVNAISPEGRIDLSLIQSRSLQEPLSVSAGEGWSDSLAEWLEQTESVSDFTLGNYVEKGNS